MKVRATKLGYYNHRRRRENEIFELTDEKQFSNRWMERLDDKPAKASKPAKEEPKAQEPSEEVI
jgi:hypothetical protein